MGEPCPALLALRGPFPQSPKPSLDGPPSHHGNSSRVFLEPQVPLPAIREAKCDSVLTVTMGPGSTLTGGLLLRHKQLI